ncbi:DsrE family protein [Sphingomonas morindae]|uniref:DsrE family protein n=1 Tax=Sphingomonas morindae TaxID=1541170 RepID=A0ABY4X5Y8_9SPHN|nr:DsrE family protein [Sphingomonas morindae]USI72323.1 DsrE family protein [Sphingomonas morindae]
MRGLTVIVTAPGRLRPALELAAAKAALGARVRLFLQGDAVGALRPPVAEADDDRFRAAGLPALAQLLEEALALNVRVIACQTGLDLAGLAATALDRRISYGGLVSLMLDLDDDRLVAL